MVIEAFHAGRRVPCPWCHGENEVPREIDFTTLARAEVADESKGAWYLWAAGAAFVVPLVLLPVAAWIWWAAHGKLSRAADEGRPSNSMLRAARWIAVMACVWQLAVLGLLLVPFLV